MTSFFVPGITFTLFYVLDQFLWGASSSAAIPSTALQTLLYLWFGISLPLTFLGSFLGFRKAVSNLISRLLLYMAAAFLPLHHPSL